MSDDNNSGGPEGPRFRVIEGGGENPTSPDEVRRNTSLRAVDASGADAFDVDAASGVEDDIHGVKAAVDAGISVEGAKAEKGVDIVRDNETPLWQVMKILRKAKRRKTSATIAGREIKNPAQALENLEGAIKAVKRCLKVDKKNLYFSRFSGDVVGESDETGAHVDALQLMKPAAMLAHSIGHEVAHMKGKVGPEGLVERYLKAIGLVTGKATSIETTSKYHEMEANFNEFINRISEGKDQNSFVKEVYRLFLKGKYESVYRLYEGNYMRKLEKQGKKAGKDPMDIEEEKVDAEDFFEKTFPQLKIDSDTNKYVLRTIEEVEEERRKEEEYDPIIQAGDRFKKRVAEFD